MLVRKRVIGMKVAGSSEYYRDFRYLVGYLGLHLGRSRRPKQYQVSFQFGFWNRYAVMHS